MASLSSKQVTSYTCRGRLKWELRPSYSFFSLEEPSGRMINVAECFAPRHCCHCTLILRALFLAWAVQVLYDDVVYTYPKHNLYIYLGYLTHWGHVLLIFYLFCSLLCCILPSKRILHQESDDTTPHSLIKWTWGLFSLVAPLELTIIVLYWGSGIAPDHTTYASVMEHGVLGLLVWMDGLLVGNVPVRAKHGVLLISTASLYLLWTIINALLGIGNGEWGPAYNDDALYPILNWHQSTQSAAILSAFVIVILAPAIFLLCWSTSLLSVKKQSVTAANEENVEEEEGNRCCCACGCSLVCDGSRRPLYNGDSKSEKEFDYNEMETSNGVVV